MSSTVATLFEHSSRETGEGETDTRMLSYKILDVHSPDIASVVFEMNELRELAKTMDERLVPLLLADCKGYDYAIASLTSVNGKGLKYLTTQTQAYTIRESSPQSNKMSVRQMITGKPEPKPMGIQVPDD